MNFIAPVAISCPSSWPLPAWTLPFKMLSIVFLVNLRRTSPRP
jgi:hypothetical protein